MTRIPRSNPRTRISININHPPLNPINIITEDRPGCSCIGCQYLSQRLKMGRGEFNYHRERISTVFGHKYRFPEPHLKATEHIKKSITSGNLPEARRNSSISSEIILYVFGRGALRDTEQYQ